DDLEHEHHRILNQRGRVELHKRLADRRYNNLRIEQRRHWHSLANSGGFHSRNSERIRFRIRFPQSSRVARRLDRVRARERTSDRRQSRSRLQQARKKVLRWWGRCKVTAESISWRRASQQLPSSG